jgi:hypothetical protein
MRLKGFGAALAIFGAVPEWLSLSFRQPQLSYFTMAAWLCQALIAQKYRFLSRFHPSLSLTLV